MSSLDPARRARTAAGQPDPAATSAEPRERTQSHDPQEARESGTADTARLLDCLAPAKLNLFLHITGRRADGYHDLQTVFQLLDWGDRLDFIRREDGQLLRTSTLAGVNADDDLCIRAARLLQSHTACALGVEIVVRKRIPMGAGLGGGSSDAATTLLALNHLWQLRLPRAQLMELGLRLGADVPFFIFGRNAFAEGVGEILQPVALPQRFFLVVTPAVHVATAAVFGAKNLTRDTKLITVTDFLAAHERTAFGRNDMQNVVAERYVEVAQVLAWFSKYAKTVSARMTGSGASVFAAFASREQAMEVQSRLPVEWQSAVAASLAVHPLFNFAS